MKHLHLWLPGRDNYQLKEISLSHHGVLLQFFFFKGKEIPEKPRCSLINRESKEVITLLLALKNVVCRLP